MTMPVSDYVTVDLDEPRGRTAAERWRSRASEP
jgi:hypothetical protein